MNRIILFSSLLVAVYSQSLPGIQQPNFNNNNTNTGSSLPGPDLLGSLVQSFGTMTQQLTGFQRVLTDISNQMNTMIRTSTRLVGGLQADVPSPPSPGSVPKPPGVPSGVPTGVPGAGGEGNIGEALIKIFTSWVNQLATMQRTLQEMNSQFTRIVQTSSRLITGGRFKRQLPGGIPNPMESFSSILSSLTRQLGDLSSQFNRILGGFGSNTNTGSNGNSNKDNTNTNNENTGGLNPLQPLTRIASETLGTIQRILPMGGR